MNYTKMLGFVLVSGVVFSASMFGMQTQVGTITSVELFKEDPTITQLGSLVFTSRVGELKYDNGVLTLPFNISKTVDIEASHYGPKIVSLLQKYEQENKKEVTHLRISVQGTTSRIGALIIPLNDETDEGKQFWAKFKGFFPLLDETEVEEGVFNDDYPEKAGDVAGLQSTTRLWRAGKIFLVAAIGVVLYYWYTR